MTKRILIEAESLREYGGWVLNSQYADQMGSPYLMAHGLGQPVPDAVGSVTLPSSGLWHVWVRTYNWTAPWFDGEGPGWFQVLMDKTPFPEKLGCTGSRWEWQYAGARVCGGEIELALHDLTGFDGRCDAIFLSDAPEPPSDDMEALRKELIPGYGTAEDGGEYDFIVAGAGIAGICAAVSAARLGLRTLLVHDRSVPGGNNSSEIRVHIGGVICLPPYPNLGNLIIEFGHTRRGNAMDAETYEDDRKMAFLAAQPGLTVLYDKNVCGVEKDGDTIAAVLVRDTRTGVLTRIEAPLFADCTGDGDLGALAGAEFRMGRESKAETGERSAAKVADCQVLGASVQWNTNECPEPRPFPLFEYGLTFSEESCFPMEKGDWNWETGLRWDPIAQAEMVRDYGMLVVYSNWSFVKNRSSHKEAFSRRELAWVAYLAGKRESRRLLGDHILDQHDIDGHILYPDASVTATWSIDLHYPDPQNTRFFPGREFITVCNQDPIRHYPIPYRCFYSKNVRNLFMAGRDISVTHVALGTVRVQRTTGMMGEVVGMAASLCHRHACSPRDIYETYLEELKALMEEGCGQKGLPNNQTEGLGQTDLEFYDSEDI